MKTAASGISELPFAAIPPPLLPLGQFLEVFLLIIFQSLEEERFRDNITLEIASIYVTLRLLRSEVSKTVLLS